MAALTAAVERLSTSDGLVVVLDLDATVWLPEVYTLRAPRGAADDWTPTRYEGKALAAGRSCIYLRFRRRIRTKSSAVDRNFL